MPKLDKKITLSTQRLMFNQIIWNKMEPAASLDVGVVTTESARPAGTGTAPFWKFSWQLSHESGIKITDVSCETAAGVTEPVAKQIDFTDFKVAFDDTPQGSLEDFNIAEAFGHRESKFLFCRQGERYYVKPADTRFQYGLRLQLVHEFGGKCKVTLRIAVVFRGAGNDFDPGGIPEALPIYPQISYEWNKIGSSARRVRQFRGSVRVIVNNKMTGSMHGMPAPNSNVANLFADSNTAGWGDHRSNVMGEGSTADTSGFPATWVVHAGRTVNKPFGWGMVFDYNRLDLNEEQEYRGVYGPDETIPYSSSRSRRYLWPQSGAVKVGDFRVVKFPRQGAYDNIHLHARMPHPDLRGNEQYHAPFCGHSCVHVHWRWSERAAAGANDDRSWQYKGWSAGPSGQAHASGASPLVPYNQKVTVALCDDSRIQSSRYSVTNILPPRPQRLPLKSLEKLIWYSADIFHTKDAPINKNEQQVIMEHGLGWGYRYAFPSDGVVPSDGVGGLVAILSDNLSDPPTQDELMTFFEDKVYPAFRYWDARGIVTNQVPEGTFDDVQIGGPKVALEDL
jgi:hypothetical protein